MNESLGSGEVRQPAALKRPWRAAVAASIGTSWSWLRLLPLRQRRGAGVPPVFFSELGPEAGTLVSLRRSRWRSCCAGRRVG